MQFKFIFPFLAFAVTTQVMAAKPIYNDGGLGCGTIISLRESTQMPLPSELQDEYGAPRTSGGEILQILSYVPGVSAIAAVVAEIATGAAVSAVSSRVQDADKAKQAASATYKDVMAVEFRFDDGLMINIPVYVVSGMRYKVGARLNAMMSPKYGSVALGANILFAGMPDVGDSEYKIACRIEDPSSRAKTLTPLISLVDEARIVNSKDRRVMEVTPQITISASVNEAK